MRDELYHSGELAVQERAGTRAMASRIGRGIQADIPSEAEPVLRGLRFAIVGSIDPAGRVWASPLTGAPGFLHRLDERTLRIATAPVPADPLAASLAAPAPAGVLAIDLTSRKRLRLNGTLERRDGGLVLETTQVFWNCPKYIQQRVPDAGSAALPRTSGEASALDQ